MIWMIALALYALIAAGILGYLLSMWLLDSDPPPTRLLVWLPPLWLPTLAVLAVLLLWAFISTAWSRRFL